MSTDRQDVDGTNALLLRHMRTWPYLLKRGNEGNHRISGFKLVIIKEQIQSLTIDHGDQKYIYVFTATGSNS